MKHFAFLSAICCFATCSHATVHTVSNMSFNPGQHSTLDAAIAAANNGDTIYVHGSTLAYAATFITKILVIIGPGHHPDKQVPLPATFTSLAVFAPNVQLIGLTIGFVGTNANGSGLVIRRCRITSYLGGAVQISANNATIEGCLFDYFNTTLCINFMNTQGHIVQHNLFATPSPKIGQVAMTSTPTQIINNVFLGDGVNFSALLTLTGAIIRNNIFYGIPAISSAASAGMSGLTVDHNLTYGAMDNNIYPLGVYPLNVIDVNPSFTAPMSIGSPHDHPFVEYTLQPTSPVIGYAQDGTQIGLYGGAAQFFTPIYIKSGEPSIAKISVFNITSPTTVPPGGTLSISVTSTRIP